MAIQSTDKLVVVKAFAPGNPLPLDAREIYDTLAEAQEYAKSSPVAYAGQTIKVVEGNTVTVYTLVPSTTEGTNFNLSFAGGGAGSGVQNIGTSATEGNIAVDVGDGTEVTSKDVPVVGSLVNPVVNEDAHTLTLTKLGATPAENSEVVIPLGGASPESGIVSVVDQGTDSLTIQVKTFDPSTETETAKTVKIFGAVTEVAVNDGVVSVGTMNKSGEIVREKQALEGFVVNPQYNDVDNSLVLPVITGVDESGNATLNQITINLDNYVNGMLVGVEKTDDTETTGAIIKFTYKDSDGVDHQQTYYETGVRKIEEGSTPDKIKVFFTNVETGDLIFNEVMIGSGSVKNPTYDASTRKITLPILQPDGTTSNLEINLGKDMVVTSGVYDNVSKNIILTLTDGSTVTIPAGDLVDVYTGGTTSTVTVSVSDDNVVTATVRLSSKSGNLVKVDTENGGIYVSEDDFTNTKSLIQQAKTDANTYSDTKDTEILAAAKQYADEKVSSSITWVDFGTLV